MFRAGLVAACLATGAFGSPTSTVAVTSVQNVSLWNDYQNCNYAFSVQGNTAGKDVFYTPYAYNSGGLPCTINYGDWTNYLNVWSADNVSTISQTNGQYWVVPGSQWAIRYPKNNTVLFPFNYAIGEQSTVSGSGSLDTWGINTLPYSNYDCDNYAIAARDDILFYTYTYRQGQGYELYVSIIAVNATTTDEIRGFYYQGDAQGSGYPTGGMATLNSSFPGVVGSDPGSGGVAAVFIASDFASLFVVTVNTTVNATTVRPALLPANITAVFGIVESPVNPADEVFLLLGVGASPSTTHSLSLDDLRRTLPPWTQSRFHPAPSSSYVGTKLLRLNVTSLTVTGSLDIPGATVMATGWDTLVAAVGPSQVTFVEASTLKVVGEAPLSPIDNYGPYVPYSASFGTGFPGDRTGWLHVLSNGGVGPGVASMRLKRASA